MSTSVIVPWTRSAEKVDDIMDDIAEQNDLQEQISEAIGRPAADMFDDVINVLT